MESYNNLPTVTIGALNGNGTVYNTGGNSGTTIFTVAPTTIRARSPARLTMAPGAATRPRVVKSGSGTQVISGTNAYTGNTTVNQGTLTIGPSGQLYTNGGNGSMYINSGGLVSVSGGIGWTYAGGPYAAFGGMTPEAGHLVINGGYSAAHRCEQCAERAAWGWTRLHRRRQWRGSRFGDGRANVFARFPL